jgi:hypothetical protein
MEAVAKNVPTSIAGTNRATMTTCPPVRSPVATNTVTRIATLATSGSQLRIGTWRAGTEATFGGPHATRVHAGTLTLVFDPLIPDRL